MHELQIARALLTVAERHLPGGTAGVCGLRIAVGGATGVVPEALELAFRALTVGTRLAGARLVIDRLPGRSRCSACAAEFEFEGLLGECPVCGTCGGELLVGTELELRSIEVAHV